MRVFVKVRTQRGKIVALDCTIGQIVAVVYTK